MPYSTTVLPLHTAHVSNFHSMKVRRGIADEFFKVVVASSAGIMTVIIYIFLRQELFNSRFLVLGGWFFAIVFVFLGRLIVRYLQVFMISKYDFGIHKVIIVGGSDPASKITEEINRNMSLGYRMVKHFPELNLLEIRKVLVGVDEVILDSAGYKPEEVSELIDLCHENHVVFKFVPGISSTLTSNFEMDIFNGVPLVELKRTALDGWGKVIKRTLDIAGSMLGLTILSPVLALCAFCVKWETAGPVFVKLKRISGNKEFELYKFRSMVRNAEELKPMLASFNERADGPLFKIRNDPRVTKVGRFIRKFRLDELPQLWNVLAGGISLVGPRPHQPDEIQKYQKHHKKVLAVKAGATGLAQASGSSDLAFEEEVALDSYYIDNWSLWLDTRIILKTMAKMVRDRSAV